LKGIGIATAAAGLGCTFPILRVLASSNVASHAQGEASSRQMGMVVDIKKCFDENVRRACARACHEEHNVPDMPDPAEEIKWIWSESYEHVFPDQAHARTADMYKDKPVLVLCNQCTSPACAKVCITGATFKRESDGIVMIDMHRCVGCRFCIAACPYGARSFNFRDPRPVLEEMGTLREDYPSRVKGAVEKCTFCVERLREGREPACVEAVKQVPGGEGALTFGDLSDPDSDVSRLLREKHTICRRISLGFGPNVFYIA